MYVVTVIFDAVPGQTGALRQALLTQAENSLREEEGCLTFDVGEDTESEGRFFLYEVYQHEAAYRAHTRTPYYANFRSNTAELAAGRIVNRWNLLRGS